MNNAGLFSRATLIIGKDLRSKWIVDFGVFFIL